MIISVKSYGSMRTYLAGLPPSGELEIPEGSRAGDVLMRLRVPPERDKVILVNGRHRSLDHLLTPGDTLIFFPPLEGG